MTVIEQAEHARLAAGEELRQFRRILEDAGLTWSEPELIVLVRNDDKYTAELKIEFYQDGDIVDIFEFFVCKDGVPLTSLDELRQWIKDNVPSVITRQTQDR